MKARGELGVSDSTSETLFKVGSFEDLRNFGERDLAPFGAILVVSDGSDRGVVMCMKSSLPEDGNLQGPYMDMVNVHR